jgi:ribonuclease HI
VAEFEALFKALIWLVRNNLDMEPITIYSDSQLVVNQMSRKWQIKEGGGIYTPYAQKCAQFMTQIPFIKFQWIPRDKNEFADALTKRALEEVGITAVLRK